MTGNRTLDKVIILANLVITLGAVGVVIYAHLFIEAPLVNQSLELEQLRSKALGQASVTPLEFKRVILNLPSSENKLRFLEIQVNIEPLTEEQKPGLVSREHIIYDAVIDIAGKMTPDELNSITGKILLEGRMKKYLNDSFQEQIVKKIYFSKFIIQ